MGGAGTVISLHSDISGSPLLATDASGNVLWKENYRPFGERQKNASSSWQNQIWFANKPYDATTGLSYMGARYYNPMIGRFMGVDPKGFDENSIYSFNRYAYANNNPYKFVDPDGRFPVIVFAPFIVSGASALISGTFNAITQYVTTGNVQWRGGGVVDAAGDGAVFGLAGASVAWMSETSPGITIFSLMFSPWTNFVLPYKDSSRSASKLFF